MNYWIAPAIQKRDATIENIRVLVEHTFDVTRNQLEGKRRFRDFIYARHAYLYLLNIKLKLGPTKLGRLIGRDHATIIHSFKTAESIMKDDPEYKRKIEYIELCINDLKVEEKKKKMNKIEWTKEMDDRLKHLYLKPFSYLRHTFGLSNTAIRARMKYLGLVRNVPKGQRKGHRLKDFVRVEDAKPQKNRHQEIIEKHKNDRYVNDYLDAINREYYSF